MSAANISELVIARACEKCTAKVSRERNGSKKKKKKNGEGKDRDFCIRCREKFCGSGFLVGSLSKMSSGTKGEIKNKKKKDEKTRKKEKMAGDAEGHERRRSKSRKTGSSGPPGVLLPFFHETFDPLR